MAPTLESLGIDRLTVEERLELIERIWASLPENLSSEEVPEWHWPILEKRLAEARENPAAARPMQEVMDRLRRRA